MTRRTIPLLRLVLIALAATMLITLSQPSQTDPMQRIQMASSCSVWERLTQPASACVPVRNSGAVAGIRG